MLPRACALSWSGDQRGLLAAKVSPGCQRGAGFPAGTPAGEQFAAALAIAQTIADNAPAAVVATRLNTLKAVEQGPLAAVAEFIETQRVLANSDDAAEGVRSFVERRPARFTGR